MKAKTTNKKIKWFAFTVLVGLLPIFARLLSNVFLDNVALFSASDFIAFGFVMHISILNELEHMHDDDNWKSINNAGSIGFVFIYGLLTFALLMLEAGAVQMNAEKLKYCSMIMAVVSFILAYIVFDRLSTKSQTSSQGDSTCLPI
ncbi:hypothetical protein A6D98_05975 [Aliivibrio fischeri]|uniref:hypothetical protein n=1 Tax=Aliivibrio fischeri TaxID=668 RepID=UPI00080E4459|nr:hypothetical protein [Aliivibrio fischeri]OCH05911.1 hypothetical protein A6E10_07545 [Aliivibrio fischeri]OCH27477.1 hypothetical protein A6E13_06940 [Aliivibrio fischeri]OCH62546.1 hypothetical protein A6D98_05975 [Aliivibrio fischeri]